MVMQRNGGTREEILEVHAEKDYLICVLDITFPDAHLVERILSKEIKYRSMRKKDLTKIVMRASVVDLAIYNHREVCKAREWCNYEAKEMRGFFESDMDDYINYWK